MINPFFTNQGPFKIEHLLSKINKENFDKHLNIDIIDIKSWCHAETHD